MSVRLTAIFATLLEALQAFLEASQAYFGNYLSAQKVFQTNTVQESKN
jgi:hypothetical protein